jgi:tetratricopeptide (TPR) repeat protein/lysophospholipase L1-like esterase
MASTVPAKRFSGWKPKVLLALCSTLIGVGIGEAAVRVLQLSPEVKPLWISSDDPQNVYIRSANPVLGYELKPDFRSNRSKDVRAHFDTNSFGQRDIERTLAKPPGVRRVILLGDSIVEGHGLEETDWTISRQLESLLSEGTEVLNFGISGYCTRAEVELLEVKGLRFNPDVVILLFVPNDFDNFNPETHGLEGVFPRPWIVKQLFLRSHLFRILAIQLNLFHFGMETDPARFNKQAIGDNNVVTGLARLSELAREHGFQPLVAVWPEFSDTEVKDFPVMPESEEELIVERLASMYAIPTLRLSAIFEKDLRENAGRTSPRRAYTIGDGLHPSRIGSQLAAEGLRSLLADLESGRFQELIERGPRESDQAAVAVARDASRRTPSYYNAFINKGNRFFEAADFPQAIRFYREALRERPGGVEALCNIGRALHQQRQYEQAAEYFRRALVGQPDFTDAAAGLGHALLLAGDHGSAMEAYQLAARLESQEYDVRFNLGTLCLQRNLLSQAVEYFTAAAQIEPDNPEPKYRLGLVRQQMEQADAAEMHFREALAAAPDHQHAAVALAQLLHEMGRSSEAAELLEGVIASGRDFFSVRHELARIRHAQGKWEQAIGAYRAAIELEPGFALPYRDLAIALRESGDVAAALAELQTALRLVERDSEAEREVQHQIRVCRALLK